MENVVALKLQGIPEKRKKTLNTYNSALKTDKSAIHIL